MGFAVGTAHLDCTARPVPGHPYSGVPSAEKSNLLPQRWSLLLWHQRPLAPPAWPFPDPLGSVKSQRLPTRHLELSEKNPRFKSMLSTFTLRRISVHTANLNWLGEFSTHFPIIFFRVFREKKKAFLKEEESISVCTDFRTQRNFDITPKLCFLKFLPQKERLSSKTGKSVFPFLSKKQRKKHTSSVSKGKHFRTAFLPLPPRRPP